ncbi:hypothetical protein MYSTI_05538 [Myxococcus stipitatus DSM 14675]|uniref:Uncharacterized protein n=1 Tax=Myxococcus stipitatus (strain DSM 14675 / JCM 12634 / Mx s8) TaxID=1278073 RepID=L7UFZ2_MYXSD|nr:hypothetical protein [Myxococcus stipitatus]AGC46815.1 hypothetical protein MYSTI_05538 [Myxococcus stipitatus DSM 14675]
MTRFRLLSWIGVLFVGQCFLLALGQTWVFLAPFLLVFGWISFLQRVLPEVTFSGRAIAEALGVTGVLAVGAHVFLRRLWRQRRADSPGPSEWPARWSVMLVAAMVLLFTATMASVGVAHHVGWMMSGRVPLTRSSWPQWNIDGSRSAGLLCETALTHVKAGTPTERLSLKLLEDPETRARAEALHVVSRVSEDQERYLLVFPRDPRSREEAGGAYCGPGLERARPLDAAAVQAWLAEPGRSPPPPPSPESVQRGLP